MHIARWFFLSSVLLGSACTGTPTTDSGTDAQPDVADIVDVAPPSDVNTDVVDATDVQDVVIDAGPPTYADMQALFDHSCAIATTQCHAAGTTASTLRLDSANSYASIVNVVSDELPRLHRVVPGDSANSYLFLKLRPATLYAIPECVMDAGASACFSSMPALPFTPLSAAGVDLVRRWIEAGAPSM